MNTMSQLIAETRSPILEAEKDGVLHDWRTIIPNLAPGHELVISDFTRHVRINHVRSLLTAVEIGRVLYDAREFFAKNYGEKYWATWVEKELTQWSEHFSLASAINYINSYLLFQRDPSLANIKLSMRVCYLLARKNVPTEAIEAVKETVKEEGQISFQKAVQIVQHHKKNSIREELEISDDIWNVIKSTKISKNRREVSRLLQLSNEHQLKVLEVLSANPSFSVREAISYIRQQNDTPLPSTVEVTPLPYKLETKTGKPWRSLAENLESEFYDLIVCEPPLTNDWLVNYGFLFKHLEQSLRPSGRLLIVAGHQNTIYIGHYQETHAPTLRAGWLFYLRARAGESKRVLGINVSAAFIPIVFFYKPPFEGLPALVSDMLSFDTDKSGITNTSTVPRYIKGIAETDGTITLSKEMEAPVIKINSIEDCVQYYTQHLLQDKQHANVLYFAPETRKRLGTAFFDGLSAAAVRCSVSTLKVFYGT